MLLHVSSVPEELQPENPDPRPDLRHKGRDRKQSQLHIFETSAKARTTSHILTSANVYQRRCGFHEGQLPATDKTRGLTAEVHRQHNKVGLLQQLFHIFTETSLNGLLIVFISKGQK